MFDEKIFNKINKSQVHIVSNIDLRIYGYSKCGFDKNKKQIWKKCHFKTFSLFAFIEENHIFRFSLRINESGKMKICRKIMKVSDSHTTIRTKKVNGRQKYKTLNLYSIVEEGNSVSIHLGTREDGQIGNSTFGITTIKERRKAQREYYKTLEGKEVREKIISKRRELGFIPLNFPFKGCHAHHIDSDYIIYVPAELHYSIGHNLRTGDGMKEINAKAFEWLLEEWRND